MVGGREYGQQDLLTKGLFFRVKQFGQEAREKEGELKQNKKKIKQTKTLPQKGNASSFSSDKGVCWGWNTLPGMEVSSVTDVN